MNPRRSTLHRLALTCSVLVAGVATSAAPLQGVQDPSPIPGDPIAGRRIFRDRGCTTCHSIWGNGGTLGPDFALVGAGASLQRLAGMFWNHTPRMIETVRARNVEWPTFSESELADIIRYVYYVKLFDEPGDPELGARWFREKRCAECHTVGEDTRRRAPPLDKYAEYIAPIALAQGMWNHGRSMRAVQESSNISMPTFLGREIADLQAFIRRESALRNRRVTLLEPPNPNVGRALFATKGCVRCHGQGGRGTRDGPDLREATQRLRVSEIAGELWNHSSRMTAAMQERGIAFPVFQGSEMSDVIAFLYYLRFDEDDGDARAGGVLYERKGCAGCHVWGVESIGPDLSQSVAVHTPLGLATAMWNHAPAMYDRIEGTEVEWPRFEGNEMRDLSLYLRHRAADLRRP